MARLLPSPVAAALLVRAGRAAVALALCGLAALCALPSLARAAAAEPVQAAGAQANLSDGAGEPAAAPEARPQKDGPLVVVLDPGHGGAHPHEGAHGRRGLVEKEISLQVALRLKALLEAAGATVLLTRDDDRDVPLAARAQLANENAADLFLSIHCNSMATPAERAVTRGVETYFLSPDPTDAESKMLAELENGGPDAAPLPRSNDPVSGILDDLALGEARNDSAVLAEVVHRALIRATGAQSRGVRQAPFLVLAGAKMPAALVEIGFISHPQEGRLLGKEKYQQRIAVALAAAVREFADRVLSRRLSQSPSLAARAQPPSIPIAGAGLAPASLAPASLAPASLAPADSGRAPTTAPVAAAATTDRAQHPVPGPPLRSAPVAATGATR